MIKAVLFDYGGVLTEAGRATGIAEALGELYGLDPSEIRSADLHAKLIVGEISAAEFFDELNKRYGEGRTHADAELFNAHNQKFITPCLPVYQLAAELRAAGIRTGILSNVYQFSADQVRAAGLYDGFDPVLLSCALHIAKPNPAFYERALEDLGLPANEVLFIDDQMRCMPPETLGMHTLQATSPQQIVDDVKAIIQKENNLTLE